MINFYCYNKLKTVIISNKPVDEVRARYGVQYEILNSINDILVLEAVKIRTLRQVPTYEVIEWIHKPRVSIPKSEETKFKMSQAKLGKPRDEETRQKISNTMKGKSNFAGKKHNYESKEKIGEKQLGNSNVKNTYWVHDPRSDKEMRVRERNRYPAGYQLGRDYYSTESMISAVKSASSNR
jgi:hypothetical protein